MNCQNDTHIFPNSSNTCACGYFHNGIAEKGKFWHDAVIAMLRAGQTDPESINLIADSLVNKSYIILQEFKKP